MSDDMLLRALDQAGDAIIVIDREGLIRGWNQHAEKLFGHRTDDVLGQNVELMIPERLRSAHDQGFGAAMDSGHLASDGKARRTKAVRPDGSKVFVEMTFAVINDDSGAAIGSVAVAREWVREPSA
ncbi:MULTISPECIES: PAS domain S-box protein [unclassified Luteococcus]|uniref:PAS domain S-box protein n=1 Tax=unclassified Luteococcus TaxID=2639923 RepID=UPI00313CF083